MTGFYERQADASSTHADPPAQNHPNEIATVGPHR
jgi:hypothetical protein